MQRLRYGLTALSTDLAEPVTVEEMRNHVKAVDPLEDDWIRSAIRGARQLVEQHTRRQLITKQWGVSYDHFPYAAGSINLPLPPLQSVDAVEYRASDGTWTTSIDTSSDSTSVTVDVAREPGRLSPVWNGYWPATRQDDNAVLIKMTAGYGDNYRSVPEPLRQAIKMLVAHWFDARETVVVGTISKEVEFGFRALCGAYRYGDYH